MSDQPIIIKKKKGHGGHGHHGGSWKVAYADFVTAMMAFFMVMWLMSMSEETKMEIQGYFNDPMGFKNSVPKANSIISLAGTHAPKKGSTKDNGVDQSDDAFQNEQKNLKQAEKKLETALEGAHDLQDLLKDVKISVTDEGLLIQLVETRGAVFFESGSAIIRPGARKLIARIAPILAASEKKMNVQGHTDAQPFAGSPMGNWSLSTERALALQQALGAGGVRQEQFGEVAGFAATRLLKPDQPFDFSNRRVTILLPRQYKPGDAPEPKDALQNQIEQGTHPQAVVVRPVAPQIKGTPHH